MGLYAVLWGKNKEMKVRNVSEETEATKLDDDMVAKDDMEMQLNAKSNGNYHVTTYTMGEKRKTCNPIQYC